MHKSAYITVIILYLSLVMTNGVTRCPDQSLEELWYVDGNTASDWTNTGGPTQFGYWFGCDDSNDCTAIQTPDGNVMKTVSLSSLPYLCTAYVTVIYDLYANLNYPGASCQVEYSINAGLTWNNIASYLVLTEMDDEVKPLANAIAINETFQLRFHITPATDVWNWCNIQYVSVCVSEGPKTCTTIPTVDPTRDPTTDPTIDPTTDPTFEPTKQPTQPSISPIDCCSLCQSYDESDDDNFGVASAENENSHIISENNDKINDESLKENLLSPFNEHTHYFFGSMECREEPELRFYVTLIAITIEHIVVCLVIYFVFKNKTNDDKETLSSIVV